MGCHFKKTFRNAREGILFCTVSEMFKAIKLASNRFTILEEYLKICLFFTITWILKNTYWLIYQNASQNALDRHLKLISKNI